MLVTGIHPSAHSGDRGELDPGHKARDDNRAIQEERGIMNFAPFCGTHMYAIFSSGPSTCAIMYEALWQSMAWIALASTILLILAHRRLQARRRLAVGLEQ